MTTTSINVKAESLTRYAKTFLLWLRTDEAKALHGDLTVKFSQFWTDRGLPVGWGGEDGKNEAATRNFLLQRGGDQIVEWGKLLDKCHAANDYTLLDEAIAQAVREYLDELGVKDEEQDEDIAQLPDEATVQ